MWLDIIYWTSPGLNSIIWLSGNNVSYFSLTRGFCHLHTVNGNFPSASSCHPYFSIRILSSAFFHPHFIIRIFYPHFIVRIFLSAIRRHPVHSLQRPVVATVVLTVTFCDLLSCKLVLLTAVPEVTYRYNTYATRTWASHRGRVLFKLFILLATVHTYVFHFQQFTLKLSKYLHVGMLYHNFPIRTRQACGSSLLQQLGEVVRSTKNARDKNWYIQGSNI